MCVDFVNEKGKYNNLHFISQLILELDRRSNTKGDLEAYENTWVDHLPCQEPSSGKYPSHHFPF